jgi:hypothetical protein
VAFPNTYIGDIVATTLENRSKKAADNVTRNNALLNRMDKRGTVRPFSGGREIWQEIEYAQNSSIGWYSGYEVLNVSPSNIFTAATFPIRQAAVAVSISGLEELQNSGAEQMIDLIAGRVKNAEGTLTALIAQGLYSDGTTAKAIGGLQYLVSTSAGSVGGIDSSTWAFWDNIRYGAVTNGGAATTSANIRRYMDSIYVQLVRGTDKPRLIVGDNTTWRLFNESLQPIQRIADAEMANAGFATISYMDNIPVVLDGGFQGNTGDPVPLGGAPAGYMYFLNTDYIQYRPHSDRNFVPLNPDRYSINQDAVVKLMAWAGNMTVSNRRLQGVLYPT